jgi:hypothetical protein
MSETVLEGSCLCGGVRYRCHGPLEGMACCHCVQCRKASGAEFATNASVDASKFEILSGEDLLRGFESSPGQERVFCGRCGSPILKKVAQQPGRVRLRLGCLDSPLDQRPLIRVFLAEKSSWSDPQDEIPRYDTLPGAKPSS